MCCENLIDVCLYGVIAELIVKIYASQVLLASLIQYASFQSVFIPIETVSLLLSKFRYAGIVF